MSREIRKPQISVFAKTPSTSGERIGQSKGVNFGFAQAKPVKIEPTVKSITKPTVKPIVKPVKVEPNVKPIVKPVKVEPIVKPPMRFKVDQKPTAFATRPPFRSYGNTSNKTYQKPPIRVKIEPKLTAKPVIKVEAKSARSQLIPSTSGETFVSAKNFDFNAAKVSQFSARPSIMHVDLRDPIQVKEFVNKKKEYERRMSLAPVDVRKSPTNMENNVKEKLELPSSFTPIRENLDFSPPKAPSIMAVNLNDSVERRKFIGMKTEYEKKRLSLAPGSDIKFFTPKSTTRKPMQSTENTQYTPSCMKTPLPTTEKFLSAKEFDFSAAKIKPLVRPSIMDINLFDSAQVKEFLAKKKEYEQQQQRMNKDCHTPTSPIERTSKSHGISSSMPAKLIQPPKFAIKPKLQNNNLFTIEETPKRSSINMQKYNVSFKKEANHIFLDYGPSSNAKESEIC